MTHDSSQETPFGDRRKAVLFCPQCGHASVADGDWIVYEEGDELVYDCPQCGTTVDSRSTSQSPL